MAKTLLAGALQIRFGADGLVVDIVGQIVVSSTDDAAFHKMYTKKLTLTAQQKTTLENFIDGKLDELKLDEGIA